MSNSTPNQQREQPTRGQLNRRTFLRVLAIGAGGLAVGAVVGWPAIRREAQLAINQAFLSDGAPGPTMPESPLVWIEIDEDNIAHLHLPKQEMGQGIHTTLAQLAAEDLELDWSRIRTYAAATDRGFDTNTSFTFGSLSTVSLYQPIRQIAATMRVMLMTAGAAQLGVTPDAVTAQDSRVFVTNAPDQALTYGAIVAAHQGEWTLPADKPALKPNAEFRYIGKPMPRVDFRDKVTGRAVFGYDARMEGMLYGAVARPPRYGAVLVNAAAGDAAAQPGVVQVVLLDGFAGVVAHTRAQAYAALEHLDLTWEGGITWSQDDLDAFMALPDEGGTLVQRVGDFDAAVSAATLIEADYSIPLASHAHLEPEGALVNVREDGSVEVYAAPQGPGYTVSAVAERLQIDAAKVHVYPTYLGGGFGRKLGTRASVEAALLAQASGKPVHVGWNRAEEMRYGYHRPPARNRLRALLDDAGQIVAMEHQIASGDIFFGVGTLPAQDVIESILGADPLALSNLAYNIPNRQVIFHRKKLPVPTGSWRGLGTMPNTFAVESFMDEVAHTAGIDPLQFRLNHLGDDDFGTRMRAVLQAAADAAGWANPTAPELHYGIAGGQLGETVVALVAAVATTDTGFAVRHAWVAIDPGLVVNPDGARAQVEGTVTMALSSVLYERLLIYDGMITADNFSLYPLITMRDVPTIDVVFVESGDTPVGGMGEALIGVVPAAIGNAVFAATGQRLRDLPLQLA